MLDYETHPSPTRTEAAQARQAALRLLTIRPRTADEMRQRLSARYGDAAADQAVVRLLDEGLLNDAEFARQWRNSRERRKPRSRGMLERELRHKGVADDIIGDALEGYDSAAAAHRAAARYAARQAANGPAVFNRRVTAFLARRGFDGAVIRQTLERLREELNAAADNED